MTDGPVVIFDINGAMVGNNVSVTKGANASLRILWNSTPEFGGINNIVVKTCRQYSVCGGFRYGRVRQAISKHCGHA